MVMEQASTLELWMEAGVKVEVEVGPFGQDGEYLQAG
jgi:hypothetical protein